MIGRVEKYLHDKISDEGTIHITLLDPEKVTQKRACETALKAESCGTAAIMVGGSTITSTEYLENVVKAIKEAVKIPVILFPNNVTGICRYADAIWFVSLLNSSDPYFIAGAQVLGAPVVKKFNLEAIPLGYIIVGEGGAASIIGRAFPIPYNKPELAAAYALAAEYLGMRFAYLEAGSGVKSCVPKEMVETVKHVISIPLIVGGGIRKGKQAKELAEAGADIIVTGTVTEADNAGDRINEIIRCIHRKRHG
jgi:phosphoglycerol geranylgeranyltransferase